ncbi:F0F1 ATP synthase subunit A [Demequina muriae]|uniref:ATP synthase subunit a n=1 Tax=Demequina muriae TaxID=3051664 RepID=A0ABT8GIM0_9MICO|nr:F0F1 ATP synthase subunit A [Demequina sp. EGI L300058]MDN4481116.1 F0F1 ATP synthase subunit A [Demequina sp. EGI L300058]
MANLALDAATEAASELAADEPGSASGFFGWLFYSDGFHAPTVGEFFPPALFGEGTFFEFNRIMLARVIAAAVLILIFWLVARRATVIPTRGQSLVEMLLDFVRVQIVEQVMSKENAKRFLPFLTTLFLAVFTFNITGVIPFINMPGTALIGLPIIMALWVYVLYLAVGIKQHGFGGYLKTSLFPAGVPKPIYILLTPIEFLQVFILRPATLALRLAANMMAGHLLLVLCFAATQYLFFEAALALKAVGSVTLIAGLAFTLFEVFVSALQAYVFVMLSSVYITMAVEEEH